MKHSMQTMLVVLALITGVSVMQAADDPNYFKLDTRWTDGTWNHWNQGTPATLAKVKHNKYVHEKTGDATTFAGCTAIAGSAVVQYFNVPSGPAEGLTPGASYSGDSSVVLATLGGTYDWATGTEDELYPRVVYDVGVCSKMTYKPNNAAVAQLYNLAPALKSYFGFTSSEYIVGPLHENLVYNQVRAGVPVILDLYGSGNLGHTVTIVGYNERSGNQVGYVFNGYGGDGDGWALLPSFSPYTWMLGGVSGFAYGNDKYVALVGKVLDAAGNAVANKTVTVKSGNEVVETLTTGAFGQYATRVSASKTEYTLSVEGYADRTVSLVHTKFPDKVDFKPGDAPEALTIYTDAAKAKAAAQAEGKLIFGVSGHDMLGWTHHLMDVAEEMGTAFSEHFVLYYSVLASYGQSTTVGCKTFDPERFVAADGMSNTAITSQTGLGYNNKDVTGIKTSITTSVLEQAVAYLESPLSKNDPVKWVWVGAAGTAELPEDWATTANWEWRDADGLKTFAQPASGNYPSKAGGTNAYMPIEVNGTADAPIYITATSAIEGWTLRVTLSYATVTITNLTKIQYGTDLSTYTYLRLTNNSTLTIPGGTGHFEVEDLDIGDGCQFFINSNRSAVSEYAFKVNVNKTGSFTLDQWGMADQANDSLAVTLELNTPTVGKVVKERILGTWSGETNNLEFNTVTVSGGIAEDETLTLASDATSFPVGTYNVVKDAEKKQYLLYYVDYDPEAAALSTNTWQGASGGAWSDAANWSQGVAPIAAEMVYVPLTDDMTLDVDAVTPSIQSVVVSTSVTEGTKPTLTLKQASNLKAVELVLEDGVALRLEGDGMVDAPVTFSPAVSGDGAVTLVTGAVTFNGTNQYTGGTVILADATLIMGNANALGSGAIAGGGTLVYPAGYPAHTTGLTDATWTGTVEVKDVTFSENTSTIERLGNAASTIRLKGENSGTLGYLNTANTAVTCASAIDLVGTLSVTRGHINRTQIFSGALTGKGTFICDETQSNRNYTVQFNDTSHFAGTMKVNINARVRIGTTGTVNSGTLLISGTANIAAGMTWSAINGMTVSGTVGGYGTLGSAVTFADGATLDATTATATASLNVTGDIACGDTLNVRMPAMAATLPEGMMVLYSKESPTTVPEITAYLADSTRALENVNGDWSAGGLMVNVTSDIKLPAATEPVEVTKPDGTTETKQESLTEAVLQEIVEKLPEDVTEVTAVVVQGTVPEEDTAKHSVEAAELFTNVLEVVKESAAATSATVVITYDFGITEMTIDADRNLLLRVKVTGGTEAMPADYAEGTKLVVCGEDGTELWRSIPGADEPAGEHCISIPLSTLPASGCNFRVRATK